MWTLEEAVLLCKAVEGFCPKFGCHVALTGGVLYKEGERKDLDLLFYRIRQVPKIDESGLLHGLQQIGLTIEKRWGWVIKAKYGEKPVDLLFPHYQGGQRDENGNY